jgi:membrane associated rhomboid family serine protease
MDDLRRPDDRDGPVADRSGGGSAAPPELPAPPSDTIATPPPAPNDARRSGPPPIPAAALGHQGPLSRADATEILDRAAELMASGDYPEAGVHYQRVVGFDDPAVTAAALVGLGQALYRMDEEEAALARWEQVFELPETPSTYRAWREVAAARVRSGDLNGAIGAYRQADRRAPSEDKAEIANRLGWLAKETGNTGASRRYFARSRGAGPAFPLPWVVIGLTVVVSFMAFSAEGGFLFELLQLDKFAVADGEYHRLFSVTLLHGNYLHLFFNMYALYIAGPIVELMYGSRLFLLFYLLCAAAGSVASFVFGGDIPAVGASGAIFGLFGILLAASRTHHPALDRRSRSLVGQLGMLIVINLAFGFAMPGIDNAAHIGGLLAGLWLGFLLVPGRVPTLRNLWQRVQPGSARSMALPALGVAALVAAIVVGIVVGTDARNGQGVAEGSGQAAARTAATPPSG